MSNHRNIIEGNLVSLCQLTHCNEILIDACAERNLITWEDKDEIEKEQIPYNRNRIFYKIMRLKDEENFQKLVQIMKEKNTVQSADVLNILECNPSGPSSRKCPEFQNSGVPTEKSVWFNVQDPITSFVGRENELKELHDMVTRNADKDTQVAVMSQLTSVSGMGGIGKTTTAREYAKRYASFFNNNIIWINAETTTSTEKSFRELAEKLGVQSKIMGQHNEKEKEVPISEVMTDVYEYLSKRKCLFVFDNVEEYKCTVAPFIPKFYEPGRIRPYILMTSREQRLVEDCKVLRLDILAIDDAEKFIKFRLQKCIGQVDNESVRKLANELQCLPLALQQAVSYIQNQVHLRSFFPGRERNPIEEYLKLLEENPNVPLNHKYQDDTMDDYAYTVMRTWDVTLKAIEREEYGRQAIEILEMLSYFPPDNIDIKEFDSAFSEEELQHSFLILDQYSLINRIGKYITIHRLVQQVIREQNKEKGREEYVLGRCLSLFVKYKDSDYIYNYDKDKYWNIWKYIASYENIVTKYRSTLAKIFVFKNIKDLEILDSSLETLERNITPFELMNPYIIFINSTFDYTDILPGDIPDWLAQKALTRLNVLIELGHYDDICNILRRASLLVQFYPFKFVLDVMELISNYCIKHSAQIITRHDKTPYHLIGYWLRLKQLLQCRMCFKLLVLEPGAESVNCIKSGKNRHPVFQKFYLFNKYLRQLGTVSNNDERKFVREVLDFCRSLCLDAEGISKLQKVDVHVCNILCLLLLYKNRVQEILSCVGKICVQMRNALMELQEIIDNLELLFYRQHKFGRTVKHITFTVRW